MSSKRRIVAFGLAVAVVVAGGAAARRGPGVEAAPVREVPRPEPVVRTPERYDLSAPLHSMAPIGAEPGQDSAPDEVIRPGNRPSAGRSWGSGPAEPPDLRPRGHPPQAAMPAPEVSFDGVGNFDNQTTVGTRLVPPDTNGDIGPNHYVQMTNVTFSVYDRRGKRLLGPSANRSLWAGLGGLCQNASRGDPIVLYDPIADRWLMSEFAFQDSGGDPVGPFYECIAVSETPDPTGRWYRWAFLISPDKLNDYPKFGVWPDGYYMSVNQFYESGGFAGVGVAVFERDKMLLGEELPRMVYFDVGAETLLYFGLLPADLDGPALPPQGAPNPFVAWDDRAWIPGAATDALRIWDFAVDWSDTSQSTFGGEDYAPNQIVATANLDPNLCLYARNCIPQRGTPQRVDAISDRLMHRLAYRRFDEHEVLVSNHTVDVDGSDQAGIHWFELRRTEGDWSLQQEGVYAPDELHRWMGSVAMDGEGNMALGYSVSSSELYPSIRYAGRLADDPAGEMAQGEATLMEGSGSQLNYDRWGDYSMMAVDPVDDCTFWYTQEYFRDSGIDWRSRVGAFRFPSCAPPEANLALTKSAAPAEISPGQTVTFTLVYANVGTTPAAGVVISDVVPTELEAARFESSPPVQATGTFSYTWQVGSLLPSEGGLITLTGRLRAEVTRPSVFTNTAGIASSGTEIDPSDNQATVVVRVAPYRGYFPLARKGWKGGP